MMLTAHTPKAPAIDFYFKGYAIAAIADVFDGVKKFVESAATAENHFKIAAEIPFSSAISSISSTCRKSSLSNDFACLTLGTNAALKFCITAMSQ